jgi:hypothetical protein
LRPPCRRFRDPPAGGDPGRAGLAGESIADIRALLGTSSFGCATGPRPGAALAVRSTVEVVETWLYRPVIRLFGAAVTYAKRLQSGRLDAYLLCMLIALVAVIAGVTALA